MKRTSSRFKHALLFIFEMNSKEAGSRNAIGREITSQHLIDAL